MNNRSNRTVSQQGKVMTNRDIYAPAFVKDLFDEMTQTYGIVNLISSFGFARLWRRQCIRSIQLSRDAIVLDLMTGMGELCPHLLKLIGRNGTVYAVDLSPVMCDRARQHMKNGEKRLQVIEANALNCPFEDESVDAVVSTFGLKTLDSGQLTMLAREVGRLLRPGGQFAFLEISVPPSWILRYPYMFYINWIIPLIGWLAAGNPDNYRLLGIYTSAFQNCNVAAASFAAAGLAVNYQSYFFGCATGIRGFKPGSEAS
jgi:demethylmenaquinone methyltransferase/2-methoxy-6-polyprenyl-1,4-benzoquinol methylase